MKVLIVNNWDQQGGAARAAYRLHRGLLDNGINSQMLVQNKSSDDYTVVGPFSNLRKLLNILKPTLDMLPNLIYRNRIKTQFSPNWLPSGYIIKTINEMESDIVHLHWFNFGMIRIEDLKKIKAPIVWSMHDNWAFTGGCHVMWNCEKYKTECGNCPNLRSKTKNDLSKRIFKRKLKAYAKLDKITIVGLSKWMITCANKSQLLKDKNIINLPNPINAKIFRPLDKEQCRILWNLPFSKKLILFGALDARSDINKGFLELSQALKLLTGDEIEFVVFGCSTPEKSQEFEFKTHYLGQLTDDISLVTLYNACDLMIVPSLQENLSNAIMESLACGIPVVAFNIGGNSDMIDHKHNGFLAKPFDVEDLKNGIEWILNHSDQSFLRGNAREKVLTSFESNLVASKYITMYERILSSRQ